MLARLPRPAAILFALVLAALCVWCVVSKPPPIKVAKKGGYTDVHLYHDIAAGVAKGGAYHATAAALHRAHSYPLKPFFTMRLPALSEMAAHFGWQAVQNLALALATVAVFLWVVALDSDAPWAFWRRDITWGERARLAEQIAAGLAIAGGGAMAMDRGLMALHEYWGGLFIAIALAGVIGWPRQWWWVVLPAALGLAIRELVLPFVLLALVFAGVERRWREVAGWLAVIAGFAVLMAWHAQEVTAVLHPGDIASPGWHAGQGFSAFLKAVVYTSVLQGLPRPLALLLAMVPLVGWCALTGRAGLFCVVLFAGYALMISLFSRPDTFYWGAIVLPGYFAGFAFVPRALWQLAGAIRGRSSPALAFGG